MSETMVFDDVDEALFAKVKAASTQAHGTVYEPDTGPDGTATTSIPLMGKVVLQYHLDSGAEELTYTVVSKPGILTLRELKNGIAATIQACRRG